MPRKANKPSQPASAPYPPRPPSQAPPPPANPTARRLIEDDLLSFVDPKYGGLLTLASVQLDSLENRAILDAVRNRGVPPQLAIANAEASALAKGNVKGPSGHSSGIGAAPPAVKTPPRVPTPPPRVPTPPPPVPSRPPSPPRAPSPSASVLSSKRPISPGSSSSGPSVAAVSVCGSDDSSMALDYEAVTPRPGSPNEPLDNAQIVANLHETIDNLFDVISLFSKSQWKEELLKDSPGLMDNELEDIHNHFLHNIKYTAHLVRPLLPAVEAPASAADAPAPRVNPRDAQPPADSSKNKPPKKKVRVEPTPSDVTPPATAPLMEVDEPAAPSSASGKAPTKPLPIPSSKRAPPPSSAPSVSFRAPSAPRKRRQGKHTAHGASRRAIILTPPADSPVTAASFTPEIINNLNRLLKSDVKSDVILTHASAEGNGICIAASRVPSPSEISFVLKHVRRIFPSPNIPIGHSPITSTSYLKIVDIPHVPASSKEWALKQHEAFINALNKSPVGASLAKLIKHKPRFMRASPHSDSCWAWVDIHDTVLGSNARLYISKFISIGGVNCQIKGARPHSGSVHCARCQRWGHHSDQCRAKCARCSLCSGPHTEANHFKCVDALSASTCANAQIVPRRSAQRTSAPIPLRTRRSVHSGKIGSIVLGLNANFLRVRLNGVQIAVAGLGRGL
ncbi:hypothetical protein AGABI1DRAFT_133207 [Agaricus bisporus var. burnettii JB137-S8]|uniref:Uncharacterized protein n=1 Tax=Agaricus bisporus var. burnettii (strain JB137-S8 / ATCC MYA-4627 / FGSC 10392) TaxID=597362 RepID=K5XJ49_AGABU|nr:uncharacterized protein AGABI1DRAFT_133207 [Agaricus bisporus var. burnettii JB137-S8]EKM74480.1 hypothetical protein AGABI1DRAFT_133207 [Agaricus bisporus var. burnettii JB137-S8]